MAILSERPDQLLSASPPSKKKHPSFPENGAKPFMDKNPIAAEAVTLTFLGRLMSKLNRLVSSTISIKNWMGPYQWTPKQVARAIRYSGYISGSCWRRLGQYHVNRHTWRLEVPLKRRSPPDEADSPSQWGQVRNVEVTHETWFTDSSSRNFRVGRIWGISVVSGSLFPMKNIFQKKQAILQ